MGCKAPAAAAQASKQKISVREVVVNQKRQKRRCAAWSGDERKSIQRNIGALVRCEYCCRWRCNDQGRQLLNCLYARALRTALNDKAAPSERTQRPRGASGPE
jgi:hypothetical protein